MEIFVLDHEWLGGLLMQMSELVEAFLVIM